MSFEHPWWLVALPLILLPAWLDRRARTTVAAVRSGAAGVLRALSLAAIVIALAGPLLRRGETPVHVVVAACSHGAGADRAAALDAARAAAPAGAKVVVVESGFPSGLDGAFAIEPRGGPPDIHRALVVARGMIPPDVPGSVSLVTDDAQVGPSFAGEAAELSRRGIRLEVRAVSRADHGALLTVRHPASVREREPFAVQVRLRSHTRLAGKLTVVAADRVVAERPVTLAKGEQELALDVVAPAAGTVELTTRFTPEGGAESADFTERTAILVQQRLTVGHLVPDAAGSDALAAILEPQGFTVRTVAAEAMTAEVATQADAWVVDDVAADRWPALAHAALREAVLQQGAGLLLAGAHQNLGPGGYAASPLAEILPVDFPQDEERRDPSVALVLIIDTSGSMGGMRIELAKEVARLSLKRLQPHDKVGIVEFYGSKRWAAPLQSASNAIEIQRALNRLQAGGGTIIYSALEESFHALRNARTRFRHVLVLTDGGVESGPFEALGRKMADAGINLNTVLIGPQGNSPFLQNLANWGRGRFYACPSRFQLPDLSFREPQTSPSPAVRDESVGLAAPAPVDALRTLRGRTLPRIGTLTTAVTRDGASNWLTTEDGRPVLSAWDQGAGRVAVMATDLFGAGAAEWRADEAYGSMLADLLRALAMGSPGSGERLAVDAWPHLLHVSGSGAVAPPRVTLSNATGVLATTDAWSDTDGRWRATFDWPADGPLTVLAREGGYLASGAAVRPLDRTARVEDATRELDRLRAALSTPASTSVAPPAAWQPVAAPCLVLALVAFLLHLLARRWPARAGSTLTAVALLAFVAPALRAQEPGPAAGEIDAALRARGTLDDLRQRADSRPVPWQIALARADGDLDQALKLVPESDRATRLDLLERLGRIDDALEVVSASLADPATTPADRSRLLWRRALLRIGSGQAAEAARDLEDAVAGGDVSRRREAAHVAGLAGFPALALKLLPANESEPPADSLRRAAWLAADQHPDEAVNVLTIAADRAPLDRDRRFLLARAVTLARRAGHLPELAARLQSGPPDPLHRAALLQILRETGRADEALSLARSATDADARHEALALAAELGRATEVIELGTKALAAFPRDGRIRRFVALTLAEERRGTEAEALIRAALPGETRTAELVGWADASSDLGIEGGFQAALEALRQRGESGPLAAALAEARHLRSHGQAAKAADIVLAVVKLARSPGDLMLLAGALESLERNADAQALYERVWKEAGTEDVGSRLAQMLSESNDAPARERGLAIYRELWLRPGTAARRVQAEERVLDAAAREGRLADLAVEFEEALDSGQASDREAKLDALLKIYSRARDSAGGAAILAQEIRRRPDQRIVLTERLARLQLQCEDFAAYERTLRELLRLDPEHELDYLQQLAMSALERGRPAVAATVVADLLARGAMLPEAAFEFAAGIYNLAGEHAAAAAAYRRTLTLHPDRIETWLLLGDALRDCRRTDQALGLFSDLIRADVPDDLFVVAVDGLLNLDASGGRMQFAEARIRERLAAHPDRVFLLRLLQDVLEQRHDDQSRARVLDELVNVAGEQRVAFLREAIDDAHNASDWKRYAAFGRELLMLEDDAPPSVFLELGETLLKQGDLRAAEQAFGRARLANEFDAVEAHVAEVYEATGHAAEAARVRARILLRHGDDPVAMLALARLWERLGRRVDALGLYRDATIRLLDVAGNGAADPADDAPDSRRSGAALVSLMARRERSSGPSADDSLAGAMRCATQPADVLVLLDRLDRAARDPARRDRTRSLDRLRDLALAFDDPTQLQRVAVIEGEWLAGTDARLKRSVAVARDRAGDLEGVLGALAESRPSGRFEKLVWRSALLADRRGDALEMAKSAPADATLQTLLACVVSGDEARAKTMLERLKSLVASKDRTAAAALRKGAAALGENIPPDLGQAQRRLDDALAQKGSARVYAVCAAIRTGTTLTAERKQEALMSILPDVKADTQGNTVTAFLGAARGILPLDQTTEFVEKAITSTTMAVVVGMRLRDLDLAVPEKRVEIGRRALGRLKGSERTQALLSLLGNRGGGALPDEVLLELVKEIDPRHIDATELSRLARVVRDGASSNNVLRAVLERVSEARPDEPFVLAARARLTTETPAQQDLARRAAKAFVEHRDASPTDVEIAGEIVAHLSTADRAALRSTDQRPNARLLDGVLRSLDGDWATLGDAVRDRALARADDVSTVMQGVEFLCQLGRTADAATVYQRHIETAPQVYAYHASRAAELLLATGRPAEALLVLDRLRSEDLGADPALRLLAAASLTDPAARQAGLRAAVAEIVRGASPFIRQGRTDFGSLETALTPLKPRPPAPASLAACLSERSALDALGFVPEARELLPAVRRAAAVGGTDLGLPFDRARVRLAAQAGGAASLLDAARGVLQVRPYDRDALRLLVAAVECGLADDADVVRRYAMRALVADRADWKAVIEMIRLMHARHDVAGSRVLLGMISAEREMLTGFDVGEDARDVVAILAEESPERLLGLAAGADTIQPELDGDILVALAQTHVPVEKIVAAYPGMDAKLDDPVSRFRVERIVLPWCGVMLRSGDAGAAARHLNAIAAPASDTFAPQAIAAAIPPFEQWKNPADASAIERVIRTQLASPDLHARLLFGRLAAVLCARFEAAGRHDEARALWTEVEARAQALSITKTWRPLP